MDDQTKIEALKEKFEISISEEKRHRYERFFLAVLSSIPWIGGMLGAVAGLSSEQDQAKTNQLHRQWLEEHTGKAKKLSLTIMEIINRLDAFGEEIQKRIESEDYLNLIRKGFRSWDQADTEEKRQLIKNLLMNAGATQLCPDDLVRLFIDWIDLYHEVHFKVIKQVHQNIGITRGGIWDKIHTIRPKENSAEADLFRLLIRDLSTGGVIRQHRETNYRGEFVKKSSERRPSGSDTMKSAFDGEDQYELTELGRQFVHYTMNEVVTRIGE